MQSSCWFLNVYIFTIMENFLMFFVIASSWAWNITTLNLSIKGEDARAISSGLVHIVNVLNGQYVYSAKSLNDKSVSNKGILFHLLKYPIFINKQFQGTHKKGV